MTTPAQPLDYEPERPTATLDRLLGVARLFMKIGLLVPLVAFAGSILALVVRLAPASDPSLRNRAARIWLTAVAVGCVNFAVLLLLFPRSYQNQGWSPRVVCSSNLRQIGLAFRMYALDYNDALPPDFPTLVQTIDITTDLFICPASNDTRGMQAGMTHEQVAASVVEGTPTCSYIYARHPNSTQSQLTARHVLVYEKPSNHSGDGMNILFGDGVVRWFPKGQYEQIIAEVEAGQNPPPSVK